MSIAVLLALSLGVAVPSAESAIDSYRGSFVQVRRVPALVRPFVTRGTVTVTAAGGIEWRIETPLAITYRFDADGMVEERPGASARRIDFARAQWLAVIVETIRAVVGGDIAVLTDRFEIVEEGPVDARRNVLTPRDPLLRKAIDRIKVESRDAHPQRVVVEQADGASLEISFNAESG